MSKFVYAFVIILFLAIVSVTYIGKQIFSRHDVPESSREFVIEQGQTVKQITNELIRLGIVKNDFWFRTHVWLKRNQSDFLAGKFELPENLSTRELIRILTTSGKQDVREIKILEGWGIGDIASYFEKEGMFNVSEFIALVGAPGWFNTNDNEFYNNLVASNRLLVYRTAGAPLEGYLFPDTYEIYSDATLEEVVEKMASNFTSKITNDLIDEINRQEKNFYKVLIMASIVEAEVQNDEDRAIVSDIFWSRMDAGIALQSDATLNYIIGGDSPSLTLAQLEIDSAYNTYKYKDLPPTPIGNPGLSSIRAAIYPANTDYLFFLSTPEGETIFSKTFQEHVIAKNKYLK